MPPALARALPYLVLIAEVLTFYRRALFLPNYIIPFDLPGFHQPLAHFAVNSFLRGEAPLWNPYTYCGSPFFANIQAQLFYPPAWIGFFLGVIFGPGALIRILVWQVAVHIMIGGIFTYWLLRRLQVGVWPAVFGATIFQLGGFFATQSQHLGAANAAAWIPLIWLSLIALSERVSLRWTGALALALSMTILAGFPAMTIAAFASCALLGALLLLWRRAGLKFIAVVAASVLWALFLSGLQLVPTLELNPMSFAYRRGDLADNLGGAPPHTFVSLVYPNFFKVFEPDKYQLQWNATFLYVYCGAAGLLLALGSVFRRDWRAALFFAATLLFALSMMGGTNRVGHEVLKILPGRLKSALYPECFMAPFLLGMGILAAFGAERFIAPRGQRWGIVLVAITALDLIAVGSNRWFNTQSTVDAPPITHERFDGSPELLAGVRKLADSARPQWRVDVFGASAGWAYAAPLTGVATANGDDPLALSRFLKVRSLFAEGPFWMRFWEVSKPGSPILDLLNVRYLLTRTDQARDKLVPPKFRLAAELPGNDVFENTQVLPRFFLVGEVRKAESLEQAAAILGTPGFDLRRIAVVEGDVKPAAAATGAIRVIEYRNNRVELEVDASHSAFLVSSDVHYPGWSARVDGQPQPLIMTNGAFRGLEVPAGRHMVTMRFAPSSLWWGLGVAAIGWALLALAFRK